jgi:prepilin-type N-terminal cleavage/methylation domain-containing protein
MRPRRSGFTLIELLIVVVIIGILAAIAIPKFNVTKGKANVTAIKTDLRNLVTAQEAYFYENATYTNQLAQLNYSRSPGVQVVNIQATAGGWAAAFTHPQAWPLTCAIYVGNIAPIAPATREGELACQ